MYACTYVLCNSAGFTKMPRLSDKGGGAIFLKGTSVHTYILCYSNGVSMTYNGGGMGGAPAMSMFYSMAVQAQLPPESILYVLTYILVCMYCMYICTYNTSVQYSCTSTVYCTPLRKHELRELALKYCIPLPPPPSIPMPITIIAFFHPNFSRRSQWPTTFS